MISGKVCETEDWLDMAREPEQMFPLSLSVNTCPSLPPQDQTRFNLYVTDADPLAWNDLLFLEKS